MPTVGLHVVGLARYPIYPTLCTSFYFRLIASSSLSLILPWIWSSVRLEVFLGITFLNDRFDLNPNSQIVGKEEKSTEEPWNFGFNSHVYTYLSLQKFTRTLDLDNLM